VVRNLLILSFAEQSGENIREAYRLIIEEGETSLPTPHRETTKIRLRI